MLNDGDFNRFDGDRFSICTINILIWMYDFASSHCNDFKNLRDDEDIVINREWILNKLAEEEN